MKIFVKDLSKRIKGFENHSACKEIQTSGLAYDSRDVKTGYTFFALTGVHTNGHIYIEDTLKKGAKAIVFSENLDFDINAWPEVCFIKADDTRQAMAVFSSLFYQEPEKEIKIIGVTGTDGKSSTVSFVYQLLNKLGVKTGFLSTVEFDNGAGIVANSFRQSTPESTEIHKFLREMLDNDCEIAIIEATSHGLSLNTSRLAEIKFDIGIVTNITSEHLEFHGTIENYTNDKANLFRQLKKDGIAIINADDEGSKGLFQIARDKALSYSLKDKKSNYFAEIISYDNDGAKFYLKENDEKIEFVLNIPGLYNVENILASIAAAQAVTKADLAGIATKVREVEAVKGRLNTIDLGQDFTVMIDYAHTAGSFEKLMPAIKATCEGRLIAVFGSAGERDIVKRPIQGKIASQFCDIIILADEDPRLEDPMKILNDIAAGIDNKILGEDLFLIPDRMTAITKAISIARPKDTVILLGKGHEASIIKKEGKIDWDEFAAAEKAIRKIMK